MTNIAAIDFSNPPTFWDCVDSDADHAKAYRITEAYAFLRRHFTMQNCDLMDRTALVPVLDRYILPSARGTLESYKGTLLDQGGYFRRKLGLTQ